MLGKDTVLPVSCVKGLRDMSGIHALCIFREQPVCAQGHQTAAPQGVVLYTVEQGQHRVWTPHL